MEIHSFAPSFNLRHATPKIRRETYLHTYFIRFGATLTFHVHVIDIIIDALKDGLNPLLF